MTERVKRRPDWYWIGMLLLVQVLAIVTALTIYDCATHPRTDTHVPRR